MLDNPPAALLVAEARKALEEGLTPGFPQKVAANALGIAGRELKLGPELAAYEMKRLAALGFREGDLGSRNAALALAIREGTALDEAALADHLIRTTIAKLMVDQPGYPAFRQWREVVQLAPPPETDASPAGAWPPRVLLAHRARQLVNSLSERRVPRWMANAR